MQHLYYQSPTKKMRKMETNIFKGLMQGKCPGCSRDLNLLKERCNTDSRKQTKEQSTPRHIFINFWNLDGGIFGGHKTKR